MGCKNSKLDELPAVALCRDRCSFLSDAIHHRYALADAHVAYLLSLKSVGISLHRFFKDNDSSTAAPPSPVLNLPAHQKVSPETDKPVVKHSHSHSHSGSHLQFHSDSDSDSDLSADSHFHHHHLSGNSSPVNTYGPINYGSYGSEDTLGSYQIGGFMNTNMNMNINYMKKTPTPSVLYQQRPFSAEPVHMEMGETSSSSYSYPYSNNYPPYAYESSSFNSYNGGSNNNGHGNGYFVSGSGYSGGPAGGMGGLEASSSKPPPPPPSPSKGSTWDFLYPFENIENYYPPHTPSSRSRDSKEVREEEGILDLEDEHEVVKEGYADHKLSQGGDGIKNYPKQLSEDHHHISKEINQEPTYNGRPKVALDNDPVEYKVHIVDKKVVGGGLRSGDGGDVAFKASVDAEVVREIQLQFERASESGGELSKILEVGRFPYKRRGAYQVSSKVLQAITPSLPHHLNTESSAIDKFDPSYMDTDQDSGMKLGNLSSTLHKLYLWEKKLYEEVKVEEKMRVLHERKCRKLKSLDERGAETNKVDATRNLVRSLSTKIRMAIQVVDKISVTINKLRDEELWPLLNEVVQGLTRMWKAMYECHHIQSQAIAQAKRLDAAATQKHFSDSQLKATMDLEHELISWTLNFSCWVSAQKGFVRSLNSWLVKCLLYIPEETADGIVPFSPGRLGAPPIFVICNQWAQAMDRISEKEVVESMRDFANSILHLWERDKLEMRNTMMANKDMERRVKNLEREDQKIHKEMQALDKRVVLASRADNGLSMTSHVVYQSETSKNVSLQSSLQRVFEAMERFVSNCVKAYDDLLLHIEEDRRDSLSRDHQSESLV